jgi:hypothetical protein
VIAFQKENSMRNSNVLTAAAVAFLVAAFSFPALAKEDGGKSCIKRQMAKGVSACIAKAKCDGITSRRDQARLCP